MPNEIISYLEMCRREEMSLQKGMNYQCGNNHSVILMSVRSNAPYLDKIEDNGETLIYEGHDARQLKNGPDSKTLDQPEKNPSGTLTENGKFHLAAQKTKNGIKPPERVRVYEKLLNGVWSYNGVFHLVDSWTENALKRNVFKFRLIAVDSNDDVTTTALDDIPHRRIIPTSVKLEVWKRDQGKCVKCGATENLHFDHILPYSLGGTSITAHNVQLLCMRHNIQKSANIE